MERALKDKEVQQGGNEEDGRLAPLYDWYTASLSLHRAMHNLLQSHSETENSLHLTYLVEEGKRKVDIKLVFVPSTRMLDSAMIDGLGEGVDVEELVESCVERNDVAGLVGGVLARARMGR